MQAYAYCGCYYTLPKSIADCANQQLQPQPQAQAQNTTMLLATNTALAALATSSENPTSAVTADKEPTPPHLIPSEDSIPATDHGPPTTSDPQNNTDSDTTWSVLNVEPSTGAELPTTTSSVISTYTTTIYAAAAAAITTTTITASASFGASTVYTCFSSDVTIPAVESTTQPAEPAARNVTAVCVGCKRGRRSKIF